MGRARLGVVPKTEAGPTSDDLYANAVDGALLRLLQEEAATMGGSVTGRPTFR
ncbi:hypothetical protein [Microbacterium sp. 18062]|uniref:hypothetical protein n=1 Tax=Microbacterium sp. 18062 TaxID=2681410 RepID=UPI0013581B8E|nr:hypothetical protein [Microbacterium sp. 18062]